MCFHVEGLRVRCNRSDAVRMLVDPYYLVLRVEDVLKMDVLDAPAGVDTTSAEACRLTVRSGASLLEMGCAEDELAEIWRPRKTFSHLCGEKSLDEMWEVSPVYVVKERDYLAARGIRIAERPVRS